MKKRLEKPRVSSFKENVEGVTPLVIWVKTALFQKNMFVKNVGSLVSLRLNVQLAQTVNRRKITYTAVLEALVKVTEEVGVAGVQAEACDLRK